MENINDKRITKHDMMVLYFTLLNPRLSWKDIIIQITWGKTALLHISMKLQQHPIELYYKCEENCFIESRTTVFTCMYIGCVQNHLLNAGTWVEECVECILFPLKYEQNKWLYREEKSVWNWFITWQFLWLSLHDQLTVQCQTMGLQTAAHITESARRAPEGVLNSNSSTSKAICA